MVFLDSEKAKRRTEEASMSIYSTRCVRCPAAARCCPPTAAAFSLCSSPAQPPAPTPTTEQRLMASGLLFQFLKLCHPKVPRLCSCTAPPLPAAGLAASVAGHAHRPPAANPPPHDSFAGLGGLPFSGCAERKE